MKYRVGDEIVLKVKTGTEENPRWEGRKVQVIGAGVDFDDNQYLCYVPRYLSMRRTFRINRVHQGYYLFDDKFLNEQGCLITEVDEIFKHIPTLVGERCSKCGTFIQWAGVDETGTFTCRRCRENPYR